MLRLSNMIRKLIRDHRRILNTARGVVDLVVNLIRDKAVADRKFLQETNFADEIDAFKSDALDNYEKHYGEKKKKDRPASKYEQWGDVADLDTPSH